MSACYTNLIQIVSCTVLFLLNALACNISNWKIRLGFEKRKPWIQLNWTDNSIFILVPRQDNNPNWVCQPSISQNLIIKPLPFGVILDGGRQTIVCWIEHTPQTCILHRDMSKELCKSPHVQMSLSHIISHKSVEFNYAFKLCLQTSNEGFCIPDNKLRTTEPQQSHSVWQAHSEPHAFFLSSWTRGHTVFIMSLTYLQVLQVMNFPGFLCLVKAANVKCVNGKGLLNHERNSGESQQVKYTC